MKKYIIISITLLFCSGLFAQGIYNNGAKIAVAIGTYLSIGGTNGNLQNEANGSIDLSGTLSLTGNMTNNVAGTDILGSVSPGSMVVLNGTTPQTLGGTTSVPFLFPNLTVNNTAGVVLTNGVQMNGSLTFANGLIDIGNSNFTFGPASFVLGTPSTTNMLISTGSGQFQKMWTTTGTFTFPIGENALTASYLPVSLTFNSGTFAPGAINGVNFVNSKYNDPSIAGSYLNRYWNISQTGISNFNSNFLLQYLTSDVTGNENSINTLQVQPLPINTFNSANVVSHQLSATGLSSFGTFTGGVLTNKTLNLTSVLLEGLYIGGGTMRQVQDAAGNHWPVGVADHITVELHDATTYSTIVYSAIDVPLSTAGTASVLIPISFNGSYYITIKHRNSLETTTGSAVLFTANTINQSFGTPLDVFGGNLQQMVDGKYTIYAGDVNHDGVIDTGDMTPIRNDSFNFLGGYLNTDINGDGLIDTGDMTNVINNSNNFIVTAHP